MTEMPKHLDARGREIQKGALVYPPTWRSPARVGRIFWSYGTGNVLVPYLTVVRGDGKRFTHRACDVVVEEFIPKATPPGEERSIGACAARFGPEHVLRYARARIVQPPHHFADSLGRDLAIGDRVTKVGKEWKQTHVVGLTVTRSGEHEALLSSLARTSCCWNEKCSDLLWQASSTPPITGWLDADGRLLAVGDRVETVARAKPGVVYDFVEHRNIIGMIDRSLVRIKFDGGTYGIIESRAVRRWQSSGLSFAHLRVKAAVVGAAEHFLQSGRVLLGLGHAGALADAFTVLRGWIASFEVSGDVLPDAHVRGMVELRDAALDLCRSGGDAYGSDALDHAVATLRTELSEWYARRAGDPAGCSEESEVAAAQYSVGQSVVYTITASFMGGLGFSVPWSGTVKSLSLDGKKVTVELKSGQQAVELTVPKSDPNLKPA